MVMTGRAPPGSTLPCSRSLLRAPPETPGPRDHLRRCLPKAAAAEVAPSVMNRANRGTLRTWMNDTRSRGTPLSIRCGKSFLPTKLFLAES